MYSICTKIVAAGLLLAPAFATAQNLVVNGGFEGATYVGAARQALPIGWTFAADRADTDGGRVLTGFGSTHSGASVFAIDQVPGPGTAWTLSQTIVTTVGTAYQFSFYAFGFPGTATVSFGTATIRTGTLDGGYRLFTGVTTATSSTTVLAFTGFNDPSTSYLDDITVVAATTTPEPAPLALAFAGLAVLGATVRRRRAA